MAKHLSLLILLSLILVSSISNARDSRFFDKVTTNAQQPQEPDFLPQKERGYGLYAEPQLPTKSDPQNVQNYNYDPIRNTNKNNYYYNNAGDFGMSDTRYMDNGKYYYDLQSESYSRNHPYNSRNNYNGNADTGYEFNGGTSSDGGYKDEFEFQDNNLQ
ncbi:protein E6 [Striga asiatica]|uniref:Protein E6 n=1 Tax=Striga asiatica TaxID=4170 RepID=A0A5A7P2E6_STRAF|nr:protein E6 [Striga asiatica]